MDHIAKVELPRKVRRKECGNHSRQKRCNSRYLECDEWRVPACPFLYTIREGMYVPSEHCIENKIHIDDQTVIFGTSWEAIKEADLMKE